MTLRGKLLLGSTLIALFFEVTGCGSGTKEVTDNVLSTPTPTPTAIQTPAASDGSYNLERHAKITASSMRSDLFAPENVADGALMYKAGAFGGFVWLPASSANNDSIRLEWNSQIEVSEVRLYDIPSTGDQVLGGFIKFENSKDKNQNIPEIAFAELPDKADAPLVIPGPGKPIDSILIRINDGKGDAGFAEIEVMGKRVDEAIAEMNLTPFAHVPDGGSSPVKSPLHSGTDTGPNRTAKVKDDDLSSASHWVASGSGENTFLDLEFDRDYKITDIHLYDLLGSMDKFTAATIDFLDGTNEQTASKAEVDTVAQFNFDPPVTADRLRIRLTEVTGLDPGLTEVEIFGTYTP